MNVESSSFILLLVLLATTIIVSQILIVQTTGICASQLTKYDIDHSNLFIESPNKMVEKINSLNIGSITNVFNNTGGVSLMCGNDHYEILFYEGKAYVEYDKTGTGLTLSKMRRLKRFFSCCRAGIKASKINNILDRCSGLQSDGSKARIISNNKVVFIGLGISIVIIACAMVYAIKGDKNTEAYSVVLNTKSENNVSYEEILKNYLTTAEWTTFMGGNPERVIVEVNGLSYENEKIRIQFSGDLGMDYTNVKRQSFTPVYFEVEGKQVDPIEALEYMERY